LDAWLGKILLFEQRITLLTDCYPNKFDQIKFIKPITEALFGLFSGLKIEAIYSSATARTSSGLQGITSQKRAFFKGKFRLLWEQSN
jgi:hypothetical protein